MSDTTPIYDLGTIKRTATFKELPITIKDGNGNPQNISGYQFKMQFKTQLNGASALTLQNGSGITITNAGGGEFSIDDFIVTLAPAKYVYDLKVTYPDTTVEFLFKGTLIVENNVTN